MSEEIVNETTSLCSVTTLERAGHGPLVGDQFLESEGHAAIPLRVESRKETAGEVKRRVEARNTPVASLAVSTLSFLPSPALLKRPPEGRPFQSGRLDCPSGRLRFATA